MPQVDLENLISVCSGSSSGRKIACETLAAASSSNNQQSQQLDSEPDPPKSFWLSKDAELDWFNRNAFYQRKDSTKRSPNIDQSSNSKNSQFFSNLKKSKASIIGLPKTQKACFADTKNRRNCKPETTRLFPKRSGSRSYKSEPSVIEPSSPKVSCMGRVRSKRDQRNRQISTRSNECEPDKKKPESKQKRGFLASLLSIFSKNEQKTTTCSKSSTVKTHDIRERLPVVEREASKRSVRMDSIEPMEDEPVRLGGMKRFASGRRSEI